MAMAGTGERLNSNAASSSVELANARSAESLAVAECRNEAVEELERDISFFLCDVKGYVGGDLAIINTQFQSPSHTKVRFARLTLNSA